MHKEVKKVQKYFLKPGYLLIYDKPLHVYSVTGSGLFVALWDNEKKYSGCCFFLYPDAKHTNQNTVLIGPVAIKNLIIKMKEFGSIVKNLRAVLIGGGFQDKYNIGRANRDIAREVLSRNNIQIVSEDTGGLLGRKFIYHMESAESVTLKLHNIRKSDWYPYKER